MHAELKKQIENQDQGSQPQFKSLIIQVRDLWYQLKALQREDQLFYERISVSLNMIKTRLNNESENLDQYIEEMIQAAFLQVLAESLRTFPSCVSEILLHFSFRQYYQENRLLVQFMPEIQNSLALEFYELAFQRPSNLHLRNNFYLFVGNLCQEEVYIRDVVLSFPNLMNNILTDAQDSNQTEITSWALASLLIEEPLPQKDILVSALEFCKLMMNSEAFSHELNPRSSIFQGSLLINVLKIVNYITQNEEISNKCSRYLLEQLTQVMRSARVEANESLKTHQYIKLEYILAIWIKITSNLTVDNLENLINYAYFLPAVMSIYQEYKVIENIYLKVIYIWMNLFCSVESITWLIKTPKLAESLFKPKLHELLSNGKLFQAYLKIRQNFMIIARIEDIRHIDIVYSIVLDLLALIERSVIIKDQELTLNVMKCYKQILNSSDKTKEYVIEMLKLRFGQNRMKETLNEVIKMTNNKELYGLAISLLENLNENYSKGTDPDMEDGGEGENFYI